MHLNTISTLIVLTLLAQCHGNKNLQTKYEWKFMDFQYENDMRRQEDLDDQTFIPDNVIPVGIDVDEHRLFVTLPRLKSGVPASLATIDLNEGSGISTPLLRPYPSWQSHRMLNANDTPDIVSAFHVKVDRCHRLWVLDTGIEGQLNDDQHFVRRLAPVRLSIFDLHNDNLIRQFSLAALNADSSIFFNIAVDDNDCDKSFAYIAKAGTPPSLAVYAYDTNESWQVKHNFFNIDPLAGNFNVSGTNYRTTEGIYGLALSEKRSNGYPDLYFHALTSLNEFNVSTAILRNKNVAESTGPFYKDFKNVGHRGVHGQAGSSVYDSGNDVIFYTLPNQNSVGCWRTTSEKYSVGDVISTPGKIDYPIDLTVDSKDRLWILSNNLQMTLNGIEMDLNRDNFHIYSMTSKEAIRNTDCEPDFIENVVHKFNKAIRNGGKTTSASSKPTAIFTVVVSAFLAWSLVL